MKFSIFKNYSISTKLSFDEVKQRLANNIEPKKTFRFNFFRQFSDKPYEGTITDNTFEISRITHTDFHPIISGTITRGIDGTEIHVQMRISRTVQFFLIFSLIIGIGLLQFFEEIFGRTFQPRNLIQPIAGYAFIIAYLKYEGFKSKKFLVDLFQGEEVKSLDN
jgi:hypothetical protein